MLGVLKKAYEKSPLFVKRAYARIPFGLRMGRTYRRMRRFLRESEYWTPEELRVYQNRQIRELIEHAYENVPYYRRIFDERGLKPDDVRTVEDLQKLPFLAKADVKRHFEDLRARNVKGFNVYYCTTGGTSGEPLGFYLDYSSYALEWAFMHDQWSRVGYLPTKRKLTLRGVPFAKGSVWQYNPIYNELQVSPFAMTEPNLRKYVQLANNYKPEFIHGYPSAVTILARHIQRTSCCFPKIEAVLAGSENVYEGQRGLIEHVLGARFFSWYGQSEKVLLAGECENGEFYHAYPQYGVLELVREDGSLISVPGEKGEIVGTGFLSRAMPFIRYKTCDWAQYAEEPCSCKRQYPLLLAVESWRREKMLVGREGNLISWAALNMHSDALDHVIRFQFRQVTPGKATLLMMRSPEYTGSDTQAIRRALAEKVGDVLDVEFEFVQSIEVTRRGKGVYIDQRLDTSRWDS